MKLHTWLMFLVTLLTGLEAAACPVRAQAASGAANQVRVTVTVTSTHQGPPPAVTKQDIVVRQNHDPRPVLSWVPAKDQNGGLDLAILIDDSSDAALGLQFSDLSAFFRSLPSAVRIGVAYASFGRAQFARGFTTDHASAAKSLRLPLGRVDEFSSIYQAVASLIQRWPADENRHEILLLSDGIDLFRGVSESFPSLNMDLQEAIDQAQRRNVVVYTLFANGASRFSRNFYLVSNGQGGLARLAFETGGEAFFQGLQTPLSFHPFLKELSALLGQQYVLTFAAAPATTSAYARLEITTELSGVELTAPARVFIPAGR